MGERMKYKKISYSYASREMLKMGCLISKFKFLVSCVKMHRDADLIQLPTNSVFVFVTVVSKIPIL